jgi:hypothetical protein
MELVSAITAHGARWATRFIREKIDTEGKFVPDAAYELRGSDLHTALVAAFLAGQSFAMDSKNSPQGAGRGFPLKGRPGRTGAQSSRRDGKKSTPPGERAQRREARARTSRKNDALWRRAKESGKPLYDNLDKL